VSYLGREDFAPAGARRAVLQERFGFDCNCQRCRCVPINRRQDFLSDCGSCFTPAPTYVFTGGLDMGFSGS
jgi:hypothetical protein